jgi:uncharacterized protein YbcI
LPRRRTIRAATPGGGDPPADADVLSTDPSSAPSLEISNAIARLHKQYVGRGPTNVRTTIDGDLVVCLLEGGHTRAEQTLDENDKGYVVAAGRLGLQEAMGDEMIEAVQSVLRRSVRSFMSANDVERDVQVEVFVLEPEST